MRVVFDTNVVLTSAVLHESARLVNTDMIVTRNTTDFKNAKLPVRLPGEI